MICHDPKFIFIHLEKCAGNSIMYALRDYSSTGFGIIKPPLAYDGGEGININDHPKFKIKAHPNLLDYEKIFKERSVEEPSLSKYYVWTCIRNPWDRALSAYLYWHNHELVEKDFLKFFSLPEVYNGSLSKYSIKLHSSKNTYIHFIRFENLEEEFQMVCVYLGIDVKSVNLPHLNKSILSTGSYKDYYTPAMIDIIAKNYEEDIKKFNYAF